MSIKTILIDVDGVVADFDTHAYGALVSQDQAAEAQATRPKGEWSIAKGLGITEAEFWQRVDNVYFWQTIKPYPGADWFIRTLAHTVKDHFGITELRFATSSGGSKNFYTPRAQWIREFNKGTGIHIPLMIFEVGTDKALLANNETMLIEDNDKNIAAFMEAGGYAVRVPRLWNKGVEDPSIGTVYDQVIDMVRRGLEGLAHEDVDR